MLVANATGCSSIFGANLPYNTMDENEQGCGPSWANSLFEDNAEFGLVLNWPQIRKRNGNATAERIT
jgi:pyruvate-ferredoxin/flavodoxin oxidoreductase